MSAVPRNLLTPHDVHMLVGFGLFAEIVVGWFLLVDPAWVRNARAESELAVVRLTHARLAAEVGDPAASAASDAAAAVPVLRTLPGEAPELTVHRFLDGWIRHAGATPRAVKVATPVEVSAGVAARKVNLELHGTFPAIAAFVARAAATSSPVAIERLTARPDEADGDRLYASFQLLVRVESTAGQTLRSMGQLQSRLVGD